MLFNGFAQGSQIAYRDFPSQEPNSYLYGRWLRRASYLAAYNDQLLRFGRVIRRNDA